MIIKTADDSGKTLQQQTTSDYRVEMCVCIVQFHAMEKMEFSRIE